MLQFRSGLLRALVERGHTVDVIAPEGDAVEGLRKLGVEFHDWRVDRKSLDPFGEAACVARLRRIYKSLRPTIAHHFALKAGIYGSLAAAAAGVPASVSSITGLGFAFTSKTPRARLARAGVIGLGRIAFRRADHVLFLNADDLATALRARLVPAATAIHVPGGEGVRTDRFAPDRSPPEAREALRRSLGVPMGTPIVTFVGRILADKGVRELAQAIRGIQATRDVACLLVGPLDDGNPSVIPRAEVATWERDSIVRHLGERSDVADLLSISDVVVLPSYREGLPQVLLEASAMQRAIVATDVPGCRDVVRHEETGLLVPARASEALRRAIVTLLDRPSLREELGARARERAISVFAEERVIERTLAIYDELLERKGLADAR